VDKVYIVVDGCEALGAFITEEEAQKWAAEDWHGGEVSAVQFNPSHEEAPVMVKWHRYSWNAHMLATTPADFVWQHTTFELEMKLDDVDNVSTTQLMGTSDASGLWVDVWVLDRPGVDFIAIARELANKVVHV
jgi:hypothetical protein